MGAGPYSIQPASSTLYTVTATNNCGMTATASTLITVNPNPNVQLLPQQLMACDQVTLTISDAAVNPGCSYSWDFGNGQTTSGNQVSAVYTQTGDYAITAVATSALGCTDTGTTTAAIVVNQSPVADFSTASPTVSILESTVLFSNQSSPATASWSWDFGDSHTSTEVSPLHTYTDTGEYAVMLIATSTMGCADTLTQFLHVLPAFTLFVPNAFTPNADGNNDVFRAYGDQVVLFNMSIYDRWGKVVYSTDNMNQGWNGYDKNNTILFPQGVYVWKIVVKGNNGRLQEKMGQVTLMN
jgi:gliding motility-associated-like protein